jgi:anti-anti-sigma regulatory factor
MLRITTLTGADTVTVTLEGRLSGPWVDELGRCWRGLTATRDADAIVVQLDGVTFIDAAGKGLLRTIRERGSTLIASECMTRATVEEIETNARGPGAVTKRDGQ